MAELTVVDLGTMPYGAALELQRAAARARIDGTIGEDLLLLVEHPPVVTLGRSSKGAHLLAGPQLLAARGVELFEVERGGDVTFHGPGQLVGYPIIDLKRHKQDLHWYLRQVEAALIRALGRFGLEASRHVGYTGVWTRGRARTLASESDGLENQPGANARVPGVAGADDPTVQHGGLRKIASIGVHARNWVTWHGFALNVSTDLTFFDLIVPCGIPEVTMTSIEVETGRVVTMTEAADAVTAAFGSVFDLVPVSQSLAVTRALIEGRVDAPGVLTAEPSA